MLGMSLLAAHSAHIAHGHSQHPQLLKSRLDLFKLVGADDAFQLFHSWFSFFVKMRLLLQTCPLPLTPRHALPSRKGMFGGPASPSSARRDLPAQPHHVQLQPFDDVAHSL